MFIAKKYNDEKVALICALFSYGNARQIVKFLSTLDFSLLHKSEKMIEKTLQNHYYRFQTSKDIIALFIALQKIDSLEEVFYKGYKKEQNVLQGIQTLINTIHLQINYSSKGFDFLVGKQSQSVSKTSTYKRMNMYLRWMVRKDCLDMGLWSRVDKKDLLIVLDTHTFNVAKKLGLLQRKSYDLKALKQLTDNLKKFCSDDPVKYDFALYRIGQEKLI